ncbi:hypothetical protein [Maribacter sp. 2210JD10-5]|uniref:hypothetical protein n=1 Tax=Maribacter sp. 2210JD10-5 TaxID=3386272 RepID=UPI0039BC2DBE
MDAATEYKEGFFVVRKEKGEYVVEIELRNGSMNGQDVKVNGDVIKFNMNIEGIERVSVMLKIKGDKMEGKTYSNEGNYSITGARQIAPM